ncbi:cation:proton antiporter regulatory subunit [Halobacteriaceae bacterium SHR40]|uniref:cation:proton antiporter regulatory subunit n=1 Tax=Halovenus amylolytica TaxID=2500550 RepID=UPI000FE3B55D
MDVSETDLPGVGKRFELDIGGGETAVIVVHNTGRREVFVRPESGADAEEVLDLTDRQARIVGSILEGAYFQPVATDTSSVTLGDNVMLEWYTLGEDAPIVGKSIEEADVRRETGATIAAIERGGDVIQSPDPDWVFEADDQLIVVGTRQHHEQFAAEAT